MEFSAAAAQPPFTLARCLRLLGDAVVGSSGPEAASSAPVLAASLHDPTAPGADSAGHLVLGVGIDPAAPGFAELRAGYAAAGAAGLVVKAAAGAAEPGETAGLPVIRIRRDADWAMIISLARAITESPAAASASGVAIGDLFGLANAVATLAGGAVSLVDYVGRIVGYSTLPEQPIDEMRRQSTLALQEPQPPALNASYQQLYRSQRALFLPGDAEQFDRVAVAIRAGGEALGAIWVIQPDGAPTDETCRLLDSVEPLVAQHLLHARVAIAGSEQRSSDLLRTLFEDQGHAHLAASQLGLLPERRHVAVAFGFRDDASRALGGGQQRLLHLIRTNAQVRFPWTQTALIGPAVVALVASDSPEHAREFAEHTVRIAEQGREHRVFAGLGGAAATTAEIGRSFREAMQATSALLSPVGSQRRGAERRTAAFDEVRVELGLARLGELVGEQGLDAGDDVTRLLAYDREHGTDFARTLLVLLNRQGNVRETAAELHVHQNTVRYRTERAGSELGIDLADPSARLWLWLRLATARLP